jgi:Cdc6-like AAA superfamily ATPase
MHIWQILTLKRKNVVSKRFTAFGEADDRAFWDDVMRVRPGPEPFYDPLDESFRTESHWHSNVATSRKNTFANRWRGAEYSSKGGIETWRFVPDYLSVIKENVLSKAGVTTRIPVYDLMAWIYRASRFPNDESLPRLRERFRTEYHLTASEYNTFFSDSTLDGLTEPTTGFFAPIPPSSQLLLELLSDVSAFDASDAISIAAQREGRIPVTKDDIVGLVTGGRRQLILQGPPGTGKTYLAKLVAQDLLRMNAATFQGAFIDPASDTWDASTLSSVANSGGWTLVQFHPTYSYEDFVRGIFAHLDQGSPSFAVRDRTFLRLCDLASRTDKPIILIIDEVNRSDLSKVLGELVYALEYRGEPVALQFADRSGTIVVPRNVILIGTMNTADESISHIDYAIRRRFDFVDVVPDRSVVAAFHDAEPLRANTLLLFDRVSLLLADAPEQAVGHSFFLQKGPRQLANSFVFQVLPLLAEYRREGLLDEGQHIELPGWPGDGLPLKHERPFDLAQLLESWLGQPNV